MAFYRTGGGGGGEAEFDFFDSLYSQSSGSTYTFSQNLKVCYVCTPKNSSATITGLYTGSGTVTTKVNTGTMVIQEIKNVSSGNTYKAPAFSVGSNGRTFLFFVGQKA